jgi:type IV secretion system protein VirD4
MAPRHSAKLVAKFIVGLVFVGVAWTLIASLVFLLGTRLIGAFAHPFYQ